MNEVNANIPALKEKADHAFGFVPVKDIGPDPNQPRKNFDPETDKELMESIASQGILQPLLLRPSESSEYIVDAGSHDTSPLDPNPTKYLIVCGERRFRAAREIGQAAVPAIIRIMNDDEAMEAQIVENLQRKDVHPMEEALAFQHLAKRGLSQEQIGARVGKGDRFVRARLVLCNLIKPWQDLFFRHAIDLETALKVCRFSTEMQKDIYKDQEITKADLADKNYRLELRDLSAYRGDLLSACFSLEDPDLNPKFGPCIGCPFNSATASLFPDDNQRPRCMNLACFKVKSEKGFKVKLEQAKTDPTVVLIKSGYRSDDDKIVKHLKDQNLEVLESQEWTEISSEDPGTYEDWKAKGYDFSGDNYDPEDSEKENRERYQSAVDEFERDKKRAEEGLASGKYKKALIVQGDEDDHTGTMKIVEINKGRGVSSSSGGSGGQTMTPAQKVAAGKANLSDVESEIARLTKDIKDTMDRQLDQGHAGIVAAYINHPASHKKTDTPLTPVERNCLIWFILDEVGGLDDLVFWLSDNNDDMAKEEVFALSIGMPAQKGKKKGGGLYHNRNKAVDFDANEPKNREAVWNFLSTIDDGKLALIFRHSALHRYNQTAFQPSANYGSDKAWILRKMIEVWNGSGEGQIDIAAIEKEVKDRLDKRINRAKDRIKELKDQKKELEEKKAKKQSAKAPAGKKEEPKAAVPKGNKAGKKTSGMVCRSCGCTDTDCKRCIERTGAPCSWAEPGLCSACVEIGAALVHFRIHPEAPEAKVSGVFRERILDLFSQFPDIPDNRIAAKLVRDSANGEQLGEAIDSPIFIKAILREYRKAVPSDKKDNPCMNEHRPRVWEALNAVPIVDYDPIKLSTLLNKLPFSGYTQYFLKGLAGGWEDGKPTDPREVAREIIHSDQFLAMLLIKQNGLTEPEKKFIDFAFPEMAASDPVVCGQIIDKLHEFWIKQDAQKDRKAKRGSKKKEHAGPAVDETDDQDDEDQAEAEPDRDLRLSIWPGAEEALKRAGITKYIDLEAIKTAVWSFPECRTKEFFLETIDADAITGNPDDGRGSGRMTPGEYIVRQAEFMALLRVGQVALTSSEAYNGWLLSDKEMEQIPPEERTRVGDGGPTGIDLKVDKLVALWGKPLQDNKTQTA
jgi:ParB/RepB/Spo0J family partition protein